MKMGMPLWRFVVLLFFAPQHFSQRRPFERFVETVRNHWLDSGRDD